MTEEKKVELASSVGRAKQWATGVFYRQEGRKLTLATRSLSIFCAASLVVITVLVMLFGTVEPTTVEQRNEISAPQEAASADKIDLPSQQEALTARSNAKDGTRSTKNETKYTAPQVVRRNSAVKIPPGTMIRATLINGASDGPVRAEATDSFELNGETLIEAGTTLLGVGQSTDERLFIRFTQMVFKDGGFTSIQAQACDASDKIAGLKGSKVGTQAFKLAASIGLNFVGGMSQALQEPDLQTSFGYRGTRPNARNALLNGASTAALEQSQTMMSEYRNKPPKMEASTGVPIFILFEVN